MHKLTGVFLMAMAAGCAGHKPTMRQAAPSGHSVEAMATPEPANPRDYKVVEGDCLWSITAARGTDPFLWPLLWKANRDQVLNPDLIETGTYLDLPDTGDLNEMDWARGVAARHPTKRRRATPGPR